MTPIRQGFEIRQMVIVDQACGLLAYEEVPAMEHMGLFGVEQMGLRSRFVGVGQQQIMKPLSGIAGEPGSPDR